MPFSSRILITGATGFVGRRVCQLWPEALPWPGVDLRERVKVEETVRQLLHHSPFDAVLHLAGISSIWNSFDDPVRMYEVNLMGTVHLLHALAREAWKGRFLFVSSGAVYGDADSVSVPLTEDSPLIPVSPYAASKVAGEHAALEWGRRTDAAVVVARTSNHAGAGQSSHFFLPSMARQITQVGRGESVLVETGNLTPYRDFLHVDDVIEAYRALLRRGHPNTVYNVASGSSRTLREILDGLIAASGRMVQTRLKSERFRAEPVRPLEIAIDRLKSHTDWRARKGFQEIFSDLVLFWEAENEKDRLDNRRLGTRRGLP